VFLTGDARTDIYGYGTQSQEKMPDILRELGIATVRLRRLTRKDHCTGFATGLTGPRRATGGPTPGP
jgi:hypothetical protein